MLLAAATLAVLLPALHAQDLYKATVLDQVGRVSIMNGAFEQAISKGDSIGTQQVIVTGPDSWARFQVSDGSTFEVFANSRVVFRQTPGNWKDLLNVIIGRVKVFIQHGPGGAPNHNEVSSPTAVISVRGTVFDVVVEDDDGTTLVTVDEGIVWVMNVTAPGDRAILNRGDFIRVFRGVQLMPKQADKGNVIRGVLRAAQDAIYQVLITRPMGGGAGGVPPIGGQGDKGKGGTTTPGKPPTPPGQVPIPGGGGGN